jgi:hypothetical protein
MEQEDRERRQRSKGSGGARAARFGRATVRPRGQCLAGYREVFLKRYREGYGPGTDSRL